MPLILTGVHDGLPLAAPLTQLLSVLLLHLRPLHEAGHDVVAGLVGLLRPVHCAHIIPWLGGEKMVSCMCTNKHVFAGIS